MQAVTCVKAPRGGEDRSGALVFDQRARPVPSLFHENLSRLSVELVCV